jgi:hypothetical protein
MSIVRFSALTTVIAVFLYGFFYINSHFNASMQVFIPEFPFFNIFFAVLAIITFRICQIGLKKSADVSVFFILGTIVLKMLLSMVMALIFIYGRKIDKLAFLISFFVPYFIYTSFEIYSLMSNLRALKK